MDKIIFASDWHLDWFERGTSGYNEVVKDLTLIKSLGFPLLYAGDLTTAHLFTDTVDAALRGFKNGVYVALGNHDFYGTSFAELKDKIRTFSRQQDVPKTRFVDEFDVIRLPDRTAIIGDSGWYSADEYHPYSDMAGPYSSGLSSKSMTDWSVITDFKGGTNPALIKRLSENLALESAYNIDKKLARVSELKNSGDPVNRLVILTHVPPFKEVQHERNDGFDSFYRNIYLGETIKDWADANKDVAITVLCGHTHTKATWRHNNIVCHVAPAEYGNVLASIMQVDSEGFYQFVGGDVIG